MWRAIFSVFALLAFVTLVEAEGLPITDQTMQMYTVAVVCPVSVENGKLTIKSKNLVVGQISD